MIKISEASNDPKTLYIWPEGVFSGYNFDELNRFKNTFLRNFKNNHFILFGVNRFNVQKNGYYNSLVIINNKFKKFTISKNKIPAGSCFEKKEINKETGTKNQKVLRFVIMPKLKNITDK